MYQITYAGAYTGTLQTLGLMREHATLDDLVDAVAPVCGMSLRDVRVMRGGDGELYVYRHADEAYSDPDGTSATLVVERV